MSAVTAGKGSLIGLIYDTNPGTEKACEAANAYALAQGGIIDCGSHHWLNLWLSFDAGAAGSQVSIVVGVTAQSTKPASADRWYQPAVWDGTVTGSVLAAAPGFGSPAITATPDAGACLHRGLEIITEPADGATDEQAILVSVSVRAAKWAIVSYGQVDAGAVSKVLGYYSLSTG